MPLENSKRINIPSLYEKIGDHSTVLDFYYLESENRYILFVLEDRSISTRSIDDAKTLHEKSVNSDTRSGIVNRREERPISIW